MESIEKLQEISATVVRNLRKQKLSMGHPFMINSRDLPAKQSYLEYPDTSIKIVSVGLDSRSFTEIRKLSNQEAAAVRKLYNLL
jgi:hypothetical protein